MNKIVSHKKAQSSKSAEMDLSFLCFFVAKFGCGLILLPVLLNDLIVFLEPFDSAE
jgi:hypothetical protein